MIVMHVRARALSVAALKAPLVAFSLGVSVGTDVANWQKCLLGQGSQVSCKCFAVLLFMREKLTYVRRPPGEMQ
jgi:hypothetical protein